MFTTQSLFFPVRNLFTSTQAKAGNQDQRQTFVPSYANMRRKGIIKKRNILPGKSDSSGSIITPSLVKTPFRCYVPLSSFFFLGISGTSKAWFHHAYLRFHFCNLMSLWKNKMRLAGFHKGSYSALFFQFDLSNRFLEFQKWVFQSFYTTQSPCNIYKTNIDWFLNFGQRVKD